MNVQNDNTVSSRDHGGAARDAFEAELEGALSREPDRNFAAVRLAFQVLLIAAIVLPLIYVAISSIADLANRKREAVYATSRVARIAEEHAIKVFDLNQGLDERVVDLLGDLDDNQIRQRQRLIHERLKKLGGGYPQVAGVSVYGHNGDLLVNSLVYPAPATDFNGRAGFMDVLTSQAMTVSPLLDGSISKQAIFNTSIARRDARGVITGAVAVSLKADYFYNFYKDLVGSERSMTVGLAREDGSVLIHYPPDAAGQALPTDDNPPFHAISDLLNRLVISSKDGGNVTLRMDGAESIIAYRRAAGYPVYVFASYPSQAIVSGWLSHVALTAAGVFVPCLVLWGVIVMSLRRLKEEEKAWLTWRDEANTRRAVAAAFRQARRTQALGNLVGSVAHDFNNLLMTMSANTQVVRRRGPNNVANEVAAIERAIKNGKLLTRQLLGVARKQPQRTELIVLQDWLPRAETLLAAAVSAEVAWVLHIDPGAWPIEVDAAELELALMNVAVNARDAMPDGGTLSVRVENLHLGDGEAFAHAGDYVRISLTDTGMGMPPSVLNRAFEPLFTTKPQGMGTGLGLPQVSGFCEQAGGTATIESESGRGSTVRFYLPRAVAVVAPSASAPTSDTSASMHDVDGAADGMPPSPPPVEALGAMSSMALADLETSPTGSAAIAGTPVSGEQIAILLVEDNPEVAAGTEALLSVMGHRTQWVDNADAAFELLLAIRDSQAAGFDLVLSDIHMPGKMTGIDLALQLRTAIPELPVVLVTGYASEIERAKQARIPVLAKPFDVEVLETLIHQASQDSLVHVIQNA